MRVNELAPAACESLLADGAAPPAPPASPHFAAAASGKSEVPEFLDLALLAVWILTMRIGCTIVNAAIGGHWFPKPPLTKPWDRASAVG